MSDPQPLYCPSCDTWFVARGGTCARCRTPLQADAGEDDLGGLPLEDELPPYGVGAGLGICFLLHLLQFPIRELTQGMGILFIGVTQLIYMVPAMIVAGVKHQPGILKGLALGAAITFLLNAACFGIVCGSFR